MGFSGEDIDRHDVQRHWQENLPIYMALRRVFDPVTAQFVGEQSAQLTDHTPEDLWYTLDNVGYTYSLPYGQSSVMPPTLFGEITAESITLTDPLEIPDRQKPQKRLIQNYQNWIEYTRHHAHYRPRVHLSENLLIDMLVENGGDVYPEKEWWESAQETQRALRQESIIGMDMHRQNRYINTFGIRTGVRPDVAAASGSYDRYVLVMSQLFPEDDMLSGTRDYVQLPIGEYGIEAADKLARTTVYLMDRVKTLDIRATLQQHCSPEDMKYASYYTARGREKHDQGVPDSDRIATLHTVAEGIGTISQILAMLCAERIEGYDNADDLIRDILDSCIIEQFTRSVMPGYIGPATLEGLYLKDPLQRNAEGRVVSLSKPVFDLLKKYQKQYAAQIIAEWIIYDEETRKPDHPVMLGMTCPAANPDGSVTQIKELYKQFYTK